MSATLKMLALWIRFLITRDTEILGDKLEEPGVQEACAESEEARLACQICDNSIQDSIEVYFND